LKDTRHWFDSCVEQAGLVNLTWKSATRYTARGRSVLAGVLIATATNVPGPWS
jgi:hypothetical protein